MRESYWKQQIRERYPAAHELMLTPDEIALVWEALDRAASFDERLMHDASGAERRQYRQRADAYSRICGKIYDQCGEQQFAGDVPGQQKAS